MSKPELTLRTLMIAVNFSDGTTWEFPASIVAEGRARYYEGREPGCYQEEFDYTMSNDYELLDWASNNMDWKDVMEHATLVDTDKWVDYSNEWVNANREVQR